MTEDRPTILSYLKEASQKVLFSIIPYILQFFLSHCNFYGTWHIKEPDLMYYKLKKNNHFYFYKDFF